MAKIVQHKPGSSSFFIVPIALNMDYSLSLKEYGLLLKILALPPDWDFSIMGLSKICADSKDSVSTGLKGLEEKKYLLRERVRNEKGHLKETIYHFSEYPFTDEQIQEILGVQPKAENPVLDKNEEKNQPKPENPILDKPHNIISSLSNNYIITNTKVLAKTNNKKTKKASTKSKTSSSKAINPSQKYSKKEIEIIELFELAKGRKANKKEMKQLDDLMETYRTSIVKALMKRITPAKANYSYLETVLLDWTENGVTDLTSLRQLLKQRRSDAKAEYEKMMKLSPEMKALALRKKKEEPLIPSDYYYDWMNEN